MTKNNNTPPNGEWGIFKKIELTPEERWDPFRTIVDEYGTKIGHQSLISRFRSERPYEFHYLQKVSSDIKKGKDTFSQ